MLTVLEVFSEKDKTKEMTRSGPYYKVQCSCSNKTIKFICGADLERKDGRETKSCGCLKRKIPKYDSNNHILSEKSGIYGFQNIYNGKWYIGKAKNLKERYQKHKSDSKNIQKYGKKQFYQAINKYGWNSFNYYILEEFDLIKNDELSKREEYWIHKKNSYKNGYNASENSSGGFYSEEHKQKCTNIIQEQNKKQKNENHPNTDFTKEEILQIFDYAMRGAPVREIYNKYKDNHKISFEGFKETYNGHHFKDYLPNGFENRPRVSTNTKVWGEDIAKIKYYLQIEDKTVDEIAKLFPNIEKRIILACKKNTQYKQIQPCID